MRRLPRFYNEVMHVEPGKGHWLDRALNPFVTVSLIALSALSLAGAANSQTPPLPQRHEIGAARHSDKQIDPYIALILHQMEHLRRVYGRYDAGNVPLFIWCSDRVWWELYKARADLRDLAGNDLRAKRAVRIWATQYRMENEVLSLLISDQLNFLIEELGLTEDQMDPIEKALRQDVHTKHRLFREIPQIPDHVGLFERINAISINTEARLLRILLPEQREDYLRLKFEALHPAPTHLAGVGSHFFIAFTSSGLRFHSRN